jgi:hypothetical protein
MDNKDLYDLVRDAQSGNKQALAQVLDMFYPDIKRVSRKRKKQEQGDLEQDLIERIIKAILKYDIASTPDLTQFCSEISK